MATLPDYTGTNMMDVKLTRSERSVWVKQSLVSLCALAGKAFWLARLEQKTIFIQHDIS